MTSNWRIKDPDKLLNRTEDEIIAMECNGFLCREIIPREDLFQSTHQQTGVIVDLGFYNDDATRNGKWRLTVIGPDYDWDKPLQSSDFLSLRQAFTKLNEVLLTNVH